MNLRGQQPRTSIPRVQRLDSALPRDAVGPLEKGRGGIPAAQWGSTEPAPPPFERPATTNAHPCRKRDKAKGKVTLELVEVGRHTDTTSYLINATIKKARIVHAVPAALLGLPVPGNRHAGTPDQGQGGPGQAAEGVPSALDPPDSVVPRPGAPGARPHLQAADRSKALAICHAASCSASVNRCSIHS